MKEELFFELIQVGLGRRERLSREPSMQEWSDLYVVSKKQAVVGVAFLALEKLNEEGLKPSSAILYEWIGQSELIKQQNIFLNKKCIELMRMFADASFESCILKGQGNALMYPEPLLRSSGDIDIWVDGKRDVIVKFCRAKADGCEIVHHHIQFPICDNVKVEVHFIPSYSIVPRYERRMQAYFEPFRCIEIEGRDLLPKDSKIYIPPKEMNLVFQMSHIARHFFYGGVGLRQLIDYYYLLKSDGLWDKDEVIGILRNLGLYKFAGAVMWVLKEAFAAEDDLLIVPYDEKRGELLMSEIMKGGNFGQYDQRLSRRLRKRSTTLSIITKNIRMMRLFPEEAIWAPIMGVWNELKYKET